MKRITLFFSFWIVLFVSSCTKTDFKELPTWNADWLLPLAHLKTSFETIKVLSKTKTTIQVPALDIGFISNSNVNVPPLSFSKVGPYKIPLSSWINTVHFDSLKINLSFTNIFPITISSGTKFSFRRTPDVNATDNIIYQYVASNNIATNESIQFNVAILNDFMTDTVYFYLEQFTSPGASNVVFSDQPCVIQIELDIIDLNKVTLYANKSAVEIDTVKIDFSKEEAPVDSTNKGIVHFYVDNGLPINFGIQLYFLDSATNQVSDSLMSPPFDIKGGQMDAGGSPMNVISQKSSMVISTDRLNRIKRANRAIFSFKINTQGYPPPYVLMNDNAYLKLQITGDLHLSIQLNSL